MAYPIVNKTLRDTAAETIVHTTGLCGSGEISAANIFDCSAVAYGLATITLSAVTTASDRWCIGEIISSSDGTAIHMVVQDHVLGENTLQVYRCTSASNSTPLGWTGTTYPGASKTLTGTVSGTHTITTHGSTVVTEVAKEVALAGVKWSVSSGHSAVLTYVGGTATSQLAYLTGGGVWDETNHFIPVTRGTAAGAAVTYGDIQIATDGAAADDSITVQATIKKLSGYNVPNYEGNGRLNFNYRG
jgi:hypothetical protein